MPRRATLSLSLSMRVFAVHERIRRKVDEGEADGRNGSERRRARRTAESEVDGGERGRAGVLLRGSVVKRIDPNHYDMSRLRSAANTMAGSSPESEISRLELCVSVKGSKKISVRPPRRFRHRFIKGHLITLNRTFTFKLRGTVDPINEKLNGEKVFIFPRHEETRTYVKVNEHKNKIISNFLVFIYRFVSEWDRTLSNTLWSTFTLT